MRSLLAYPRGGILIAIFFCGLPVLLVSEENKSAHKSTEISPAPKTGTSIPSGPVLRLIQSWGCAKRTGYPKELSMHGAVWEILQEIQENRLDPAEFKKFLRTLYRQETYDWNMVGPNTGFLPELKDSGLIEGNFDRIKNAKNPVYMAFDHLIFLMDKKYSADDRSAENLAYWMERVDETARILDAWVKRAEFKNLEKSLLDTSCNWVKKKGWNGESFRNRILTLQSQLRRPAISTDFAARHAGIKPDDPYQAPANFGPIDASEMARRFLGTLWCDNLADLYWELAYRISLGQFTAESFANALEDHYSSLKKSPDYAGLDMKVTGRGFLDPKARFPDFFAALSYLEKPTLTKVEKWNHLISNHNELLRIESKILAWQKNFLVDKNGYRRPCRERPSGQIGQELRVRIHEQIQSRREQQLKESEIQFQEEMSAHAADLKAKLDSLHSEEMAAQQSETRSKLDQLTEVGQVVAAFTSQREDAWKRCEDAFKGRINTILDPHIDQMRNLIDWSAEDYRKEYGKDLDGFGGACAAKGRSSPWPKGAVISTIYRTFAEDYSEEVRKRSEAVRKEHDRLINQPGLSPQDLDKKLLDYQSKVLSDARTKLLREFRTLFYVACAESDFTPLYSMAFSKSGSSYDYVKNSNYSLAGIRDYKARMLAKARAGRHPHSVIYYQGNHAVYQSSIDRFVIGENARGYILNTIREKFLPVTQINGKTRYDKPRALRNIRRYCQTDRNFNAFEVHEIDEEIFDAVANINRNGEADDYELDSIMDLQTAKQAKNASTNAIVAYAMLHALCLPFSTELHRMTMNDFPKGDYYETLTLKGVKSTCSEDGRKYELCSSPLKELATQIEKLALPVGQKTLDIQRALAKLRDLRAGNDWKALASIPEAANCRYDFDRLDLQEKEEMAQLNEKAKQIGVDLGIQRQRIQDRKQDAINEYTKASEASNAAKKARDERIRKNLNGI